MECDWVKIIKSALNNSAIDFSATKEFVFPLTSTWSGNVDVDIIVVVYAIIIITNIALLHLLSTNAENPFVFLLYEYYIAWLKQTIRKNK